MSEVPSRCSSSRAGAWPKRLLPAGLMCLLSACSTLETDSYRQQAEKQRQAYAQWQQPQNDAVSVASLDDLIALPGLAALVEQGLDANPGVQQTALALTIARRHTTVAGADRLPQAGLSLNRNRKEDQDTSYNAGLTVSWELDVWQKLGDSASAAEAKLAGSAAAHQGTRDLLAANIMRTWLQLVQQQQTIAIESSRLAVLETNEAVIVDRYRKGLGELNELDTARTNSESSRATLAASRESYAQLHRTLMQLLGASDEQSRRAIDDSLVTEFPQVLTPLAKLPPQDLARRPDLQQAYSAIQSAQFERAVAYKSLLPSFSLQASLNDAGANLGDALFKSPAWGLLGQLTAPLFQGGRLKAQAEIADLTAHQRVWAYRETLLTAITEVENALGQEQALAKQQIHIANALANAERSAEFYGDKYRQGLVTLLDLLQVQQQTFDLKSQLSQVIYNRLANRITLGLALGLGVS